MPKVSRESAPNVEDQGPAIDRWADLDGYRAEFVTINADSDLTPLLDTSSVAACGSSSTAAKSRTDRATRST